jgi:hypothetical protein
LEKCQYIKAVRTILSSDNGRVFNQSPANNEPKIRIFLELKPLQLALSAKYARSGARRMGEVS